MAEQPAETLQQLRELERENADLRRTIVHLRQIADANYRRAEYLQRAHESAVRLAVSMHPTRARE